MTDQSLPRVVFMGTPDFAVASLRSLVQAGFPVVGVITAPDRPAGRGRKAQPSAVKLVAEQLGLPVLQPTNLKAPSFQAELAALHADLQIVVAFRMLPESIWSRPPLGTFNLHASLLPAYRGAAPINWAIINGEAVSGATTFLLDKQIDTGALLLQRKLTIKEGATAGWLHDELRQLGAGLVVETAQGLANGTLTPTPQTPTGAEPAAPKLFAEDLQLNWAQPAQRIVQRIKGLSPYPAARTRLSGEVFKILDARVVEQPLAGEPGSFHVQDGSWRVRTLEDDLAVELLQVQRAGKKAMSVEALLRGFHPTESAFQPVA